MTATQIRHAARWLRARAQAVAVARADWTRARWARRARVARQARDAQGRWIPARQEAA